jgi:hypothetical protein
MLALKKATGKQSNLLNFETKIHFLEENRIFMGIFRNLA